MSGVVSQLDSELKMSFSSNAQRRKRGKAKKPKGCKLLQEAHTVLLFRAALLCLGRLS
jgi:hypothetical protein